MAGPQANKARQAASGAGTGTRIPAALQAVFLASNRGGEVNQPPPNLVAARTYRQRTKWNFWSGSKRDLGTDAAAASKSNSTHPTKPSSGRTRKKSSPSDGSADRHHHKSSSCGSKPVERSSALSFKGSGPPPTTRGGKSLTLPDDDGRSGFIKKSERTLTVEADLRASRQQRHSSPTKTRPPSDASPQQKKSKSRTRSASELPSSSSRQQSTSNGILAMASSSKPGLESDGNLKRSGSSGGKPTAPGSPRKSSTKKSLEANEGSDHQTSRRKKGARPMSALLSPQSLLDGLLHSRGYCTKRFSTLQTAYHNRPTALQQASHHVNLIRLVRERDLENFQAIMRSGISLNPCNAYGESMVHLICRRGDSELLKILLDNGCSLQVSDDYGRTPLHDACWGVKPCFPLIELIMSREPRLFHMTDARGAVPLTYVRRDNWQAWLSFIEAKKDVYWPQRDMRRQGEQPPPPLTTLPPHSNPVPDPFNALTPQLAGMVASGQMTPFEAEYLRTQLDDDDDEDDDDEEYGSGEDYDSDCQSDASSTYDMSESSDESSFDEEEMSEILKTLTPCRKAAVVATS